MVVDRLKAGRGSKALERLVSIIVPVHNTRQYLSQCIDSILEQSYKNIEIILVNDDSTDGSEIIIDQYIEKDDRISSFTVSLHNAALVRRAGIAVARGEYICFVDSDDILHVDYVSRLIDAVNRHNVKVASAKISNFRGELILDTAQNTDTNNIRIEKDMLAYFADNYHSTGDEPRQIAQSINAKIFTRDILEGIDYSILKTSVLEDNYIVPQILKSLEGDKIALIDSTLYYYRINSDSTMSKVLDGKITYGNTTIYYPELFEITMEYIKNIFSNHIDTEARINKIRAQQYLNLTKHIFHQNKNIDKLRNELEDATNRVNSLQVTLEQITDEKLALEKSTSYRIGSRLIRLVRPVKMFAKRLNVGDDSNKKEKR